MTAAPALNLTFVTPQLAVGGALPQGGVERLAREHGVGAVADLRSEACDDAGEMARHGIAFVHLPTEDHGAISPPRLARGVAFVGEHLDAGRRVLVHCQHGIGRSVLLTLCVLAELGHEPLAALTLIKDGRAVASPSPAQYDAWAAWVSDRGQSAPGFNAFKAVAYRHLPEFGGAG